MWPSWLERRLRMSLDLRGVFIVVPFFPGHNFGCSRRLVSNPFVCLSKISLRVATLSGDHSGVEDTSIPGRTAQHIMCWEVQEQSVHKKKINANAQLNHEWEMA